jgi:hypothetical protein
MGETIGMLIALCVIFSFVMYMVIFFCTAPKDAFNNYYENKPSNNKARIIYPTVYDEHARVCMEKRLKEKEKMAHKTRTQYPAPSDKVTTFEITNIKNSTVVTETVYV